MSTRERAVPKDPVCEGALPRLPLYDAPRTSGTLSASATGLIACAAQGGAPAFSEAEQAGRMAGRVVPGVAFAISRRKADTCAQA